MTPRPDPVGPIWPLFAAAAAATPDAPCLLADGRRLTYADTAAAACAIAARLNALGVGKGDFVGLLDSRSVNAVVGMLGILRAGGAFVPLDPTTPPNSCRSSPPTCR